MEEINSINLNVKIIGASNVDEQLRKTHRKIDFYNKID